MNSPTKYLTIILSLAFANVFAQNDNLLKDLVPQMWSKASGFSVKNRNIKYDNESISIAENESKESAQIIFEIGSEFAIQTKINDPLKTKKVYEFSFLIKVSEQDTNIINYGFSFFSKNNKSIYPNVRGKTISKVKENHEHVLYPYIRLTDSIIPNQWNKLTYTVLSDGGEQKIIFRKLPTPISKTGNIVYIKDIKLIELDLPIKLENDNYLLNGDFEYYYKCPDELWAYSSFYGWNNHPRNVANSENGNLSLDLNTGRIEVIQYIPELGSPDLWCDCFGLIPKYIPYPKSGHCYGHIYMGMSKKDRIGLEYLETKLKSNLDSGVVYNISFWYIRPQYCETATNTLGLQLSDKPFYIENNQKNKNKTYRLNKPNFLVSDTINPADTLWTLFSRDFIANGTEKFLIIGAFYNSNEEYRHIPKIEKGLVLQTSKKSEYLIDNIILRRNK